jgi:hypothetical protein
MFVFSAFSSALQGIDAFLVVFVQACEAALLRGFGVVPYLWKKKKFEVRV